MATIAVVAAALGSAVGDTSIGRSIDGAAVDAQFRLRGSESSHTRDVVIVGVDDSTLNDPTLPRWPFPNDVHGRAIEKLEAAGARVVAYDIQLQARGGTPQLLRAIRRAPRPVILGTGGLPGGRYSMPLGDVERIRAAGGRVASLRVPVDPDGVVRRTVLHHLGLPTVAGAVAAALHPGRRLPPSGGLVDFAGPAGTVREIPFSSILAGAFDPRSIKGKTVVVGETASILHDAFPVSTGPTMGGPEIQANAIQSAERDFPLRDAPSSTQTIIVALLALLPALAGLRLGGPAIGLGSSVLFGALLVASQLAFESGVVLPVAAGAIALVASAVAAIADTQRERRQRLRLLFAAHAPDLVQSVLEGEGPPIAPNRIIAGYRIEEEIGRGGMGVVYRATQLALERPVALKLIAADRAKDPEFRARFRRESRIAASLHHPNVIPVFEAGEDDGLLYIVMQFVDGIDLEMVIDRLGPLQPTQAIDVLEQVASALDAAHARGLVHRDVKPANILLTADERPHVYLTDFGVAREAEGATDLTGSSGWVGTLDYISPEQFHGHGADARGDVYALAAVLFCCLVGEPPYASETAAGKMFAHVGGEPPRVSARRREIGTAIDSVVKSGLAKDPAARPSTAMQFARRAREALTPADPGHRSGDEMHAANR